MALTEAQILEAHTSTFLADAAHANGLLHGYQPNPALFPFAGDVINTVAAGGTPESRDNQPFVVTRMFYELASSINNGRKAPPELAQAVGGLLLRLGVNCAEPAALEVTGVTVVDSGYCSHAEGYFLDVLKMLKGSLAHSFHDNVTVYCTPNGVPALIQKTYEHPSALTLVPMRAGELHLPTGTLVMPPDYARYKSLGVPAALHTAEGTCILGVYELPDNPITLNIGRLAAFAFSDRRTRACFGANNGLLNGRGWNNVHVSRSNANAASKIDNFRQAALQVMAQCGVAAPDGITG